MEIRPYRPADCKEMAELFYNTVHSVNVRDYSVPQVNAWATGQVDLVQWNCSFLAHLSLVAVDGATIVGFGDIASDGYLDRLYVHADHQGQGIATSLCELLEQSVQGNITTHASITAKPFFEKRGYTVVKEQTVERRGILLTNYVMVKAKEN